MEGTSKFSARAVFIDFVIRVLIPPLCCPHCCKARPCLLGFESGKRQTLPSWDCLKEDIRSASSSRRNSLPVDPEEQAGMGALQDSCGIYLCFLPFLDQDLLVKLFFLFSMLGKVTHTLLPP